MTGELREKLIHFINDAEPFILHNHMRVTAVDEGTATVELELRPESLNRWNGPHGGALFTMGDMAAGLAVLTVRQESCMTLNASIDYLAKAGPTGRLAATARVRQSGGKISFCDVEIRDEPGQLIARLSTVMYFTGRALEL